MQHQINTGLQTRKIIRKVSSTFWFIREILPYGKDCQVISPTSVRQKIIDELGLLNRHYTQDTKLP